MRGVNITLNGLTYFVKSGVKTTSTAKEIAQHGDAILRKISIDLVLDSRIYGEFHSQVLGFLNSNAFLAQCRRPMKFKIKPDNKVNEHTRADRTEMWIWFLYVNYGKAAVKRYLLKELDKYYKKHF